MSLSTIDKQLIEKLLQMGSGYVLDFSDRTMEEFFGDELGVNIYDEKYNHASGSKANRIRGYFRVSSDKEISKVIQKLIEYIEAKIAMGDFKVEDFPQERINAVKKSLKKLSNNEEEGFYKNFKRDLGGEVTFKHDDNNGLYVIGEKDYVFGLKFTTAGDQSVYIYNDDPSINCLAQVENTSDLESIDSEVVYNGTSRIRTPKVGDVILLKNTRGRYAAIKITGVLRDQEDERRNTVSFEYLIFSKSTKFNIAREKKIQTDAYVDEDSIQIILNKEVFGHVKSLLDSGHYYNAVEEAYKIVRELLRTKTGEEKAHQAFSESNIKKSFKMKRKLKQSLILEKELSFYIWRFKNSGMKNLILRHKKWIRI